MNFVHAANRPAAGTINLGIGDRARPEPIAEGSTNVDSRSQSSRPHAIALRSLCKADLGSDDLSDCVFGNYRLSQRLGRGGMGVVYQATHLSLGKEFAIKFIASEVGDSAAVRQRFIREYQSLGQLNHPHIIDVVDAGSIDGLNFYVTDLLIGKDLSRWLSQRPRPSLGAVCELMRQTALGLGHAHEHRLLHRDIKPSNLFLESSGNVKLLDFGLVRCERDVADLTSSDQIVGTVDYMSPEQAENAQQCAAASDLYSLGATMLFLLSGAPPFPDAEYPNLVSKLRGHLGEVPPWLEANRTSLPRDLRTLIESMLSKSPNDRPDSASQVAERLKRWADRGQLNRWLDVPSTRSPETPSLTTAQSDIRHRFGSSRRMLPWLIAGAVLTAVSLASFPLFCNNSSTAPVVSTSQADAAKDQPTMVTSSVRSATLNARPLRVRPSKPDPTRPGSIAP